MYESAVFWLPIIGGILLGGFAVGEWYGGNKVYALWVGFSGVVCFLAVAGLQIQQVLLKQEAVTSPEKAQQNVIQTDIRRARLSIEFVAPLSLNVTYFPPHAPDIRSFRIDLPITVRNYGQMPATVTKIDAQLIVPNAGGLNADPPDDPANIAAAYTSEFANRIWRSGYEGKIVAPSEKLASFFPASFDFMNRPNILWHMEGLPKWLLVVVNYTDPLGTEGVTSYYGEVSGSMGITAIANSTYNFWR